MRVAAVLATAQTAQAGFVHSCLEIASMGLHADTAPNLAAHSRHCPRQIVPKSSPQGASNVQLAPKQPDLRHPPTAARDASLMGVKSLVANSVYDAEGNLVGTLEEIVLDTRTGCVRHAVLAVGGVLGIGRKRLAVPWSALNPDAQFRRCVVDVTHMRFTAVPVPDDDPWLQRNHADLTTTRRAGNASFADANQS